MNGLDGLTDLRSTSMNDKKGGGSAGLSPEARGGSWHNDTLKPFPNLSLYTTRGYRF